jgi:hypothetical protein
MKRRIKTWSVLDSLARELREAIDNGDVELIPGIAWELCFRAARYAQRKCDSRRIRGMWFDLRQRIPNLSPPLREDYTALLTELKGLDKVAHYAEDIWEIDDEEITQLAEDALRFIADVRALAISKGDAS